MEELQRIFPGQKIHKVLITPVDYRRLWSSLDRHASSVELIAVPPDGNGAEDLLEQKKGNAETRLVAIYESLLLDAVADRASDIHLELYPGGVRVRLRVDGELRDLHHYQMNEEEYRGLVNVVKLRSELNIAERRLPPTSACCAIRLAWCWLSGLRGRARPRRSMPGCSCLRRTLHARLLP